MCINIKYIYVYAKCVVQEILKGAESESEIILKNKIIKIA